LHGLGVSRGTSKVERAKAGVIHDRAIGAVLEQQSDQGEVAVQRGSSMKSLASMPLVVPRQDIACKRWPRIDESAPACCRELANKADAVTEAARIPSHGAAVRIASQRIRRPSFDVCQTFIILTRWRPWRGSEPSISSVKISRFPSRR
jgi:hypothetical protein